MSDTVQINGKLVRKGSPEYMAMMGLTAPAPTVHYFDGAPPGVEVKDDPVVAAANALAQSTQPFDSETPWERQNKFESAARTQELLLEAYEKLRGIFTDLVFNQGMDPSLLIDLLAV